MNPFHLTPRLLFDVPATFVIFLPCKVAPAASRQEEKAIYCLILQMLLEITFNNTNSTELSLAAKESSTQSLITYFILCKTRR